MTGILLSATARTTFFFVEGHQIFDATAAARDDQQIRPRNQTVFGQRVEAANGSGNLLGGRFALHRNRPDQNRPGKTFFEPMQDITNNRAGW